MADTDEAEDAFRHLFAWIQGGAAEDSHGGEPYRWNRDGYQATHMRTSPAGPFMHISGPDSLVAYLRPERRGEARMDYRGKATREMLLALAEVPGPTQGRPPSR